MTTAPRPPSATDDTGPIDATSDTELVDRVRAGDVEAFGALWSRHVDVARAFARTIASRDAEDLISESYVRVLSAIRSGKGPQSAFRAYLLSTIRHVHIDNVRRYHSRVVVTDSMDVLDRVEAQTPEDIAITGALGSAALAAWHSLPDDTRSLLWDLIVHEETPARLAGGLGATPNAVASRASRARQRLRQAFAGIVGTLEPALPGAVPRDLPGFEGP